MKKRCEGVLQRIDGAHEQCDNMAQHGSDSCRADSWKQKAVRLSDETIVSETANEI